MKKKIILYLMLIKKKKRKKKEREILYAIYLLTFGYIHTHVYSEDLISCSSLIFYFIVSFDISKHKTQKKTLFCSSVDTYSFFFCLNVLIALSRIVFTLFVSPSSAFACLCLFIYSL
jgi:hypothetical protein